jgi:RNA polymerase-binding protein DksA
MQDHQAAQYFDQLTKRRDHLLATLRYIQREYEQAEQNTDWLDQAAYKNRTALLDRLQEWYLAELKKIDRALARVKTENYGICAACHQAIDVNRLAAEPSTEYCAPCERLRENFESNRA